MMHWDVVQEISLKKSNLSSGGHVVQLISFGRGHYEEHFCEIILNFDKWFRRRCYLKMFSYLELWWPFCSAQPNHYVILVEGIMK